MIYAIKYDNKKKQWYYEQNGQFIKPVPLGKAVSTDNGTYQFNSDGTKTIVEYPDKTKNYDTSHKGKYIQHRHYCK